MRLRITNLTCFLLLAPFSILLPVSLYGQSKTDSLAIEGILQQETLAWNKGDAKAYSQSFAPEGTFTNIMGMFFVGQQEFEKRHEQIFKGPFSRTQMQQKLVSLQFLATDVAVVETLIWVSGFSAAGPPKGTQPDEKGRLRTRLLQVLVRQANNWRITTYHNVDIKPGVPVPEP
jgi:uncharacterized protein (TIGR02246 family)